MRLFLVAIAKEDTPCTAGIISVGRSKEGTERNGQFSTTCYLVETATISIEDIVVIGLMFGFDEKTGLTLVRGV